MYEKFDKKRREFENFINVMQMQEQLDQQKRSTNSNISNNQPMSVYKQYSPKAPNQGLYQPGNQVSNFDDTGFVSLDPNPQPFPPVEEINNGLGMDNRPKLPGFQNVLEDVIHKQDDLVDEYVPLDSNPPPLQPPLPSGQYYGHQPYNFNNQNNNGFLINQNFAPPKDYKQTLGVQPEIDEQVDNLQSLYYSNNALMQNQNAKSNNSYVPFNNPPINNPQNYPFNNHMQAQQQTNSKSQTYAMPAQPNTNLIGYNNQYVNHNVHPNEQYNGNIYAYPVNNMPPQPYVQPQNPGEFQPPNNPQFSQYNGQNANYPNNGYNPYNYPRGNNP